MKNISRFILAFSCIFSVTQILPMHTRLSHLRKPAHHAAQLGVRNISDAELMLIPPLCLVAINTYGCYKSTSLETTCMYSSSSIIAGYSYSSPAGFIVAGGLTSFGFLVDAINQERKRMDSEKQSTLFSKEDIKTTPVSINNDSQAEKIAKLEKQVADLQKIVAAQSVKKEEPKKPYIEN